MISVCARLLTCVVLMALSSLPAIADPGDILWTYDTGGAVFASPALRPDGTLYIGSNDSKFYALTPGATQAALKWSYDAGDWIDSSAALGPDGTVYVATYDSKLLALNPDTGSLDWELSVGETGGEFGVIQSSPAILSNGAIVFTTLAGFTHCVSSSGEELWIYEMGADSRSSVAVDMQGRLYFGADDGLVYCLNDQGEEQWTYAVDGAGEEASRIYSSPAIDANGHIYIGSGNGNLYSLTSDGSLRWKFTTSESVDVSPVIDAENQIYFASRNGIAYCLNASGAEIWSLFLGDVFYSSPILDTLGNAYYTYFGGQNRTFVVCIATGGHDIWQTQIDSVIDSSLTLSIDGVLYVGAFDGKVYAIEASSRPFGASYPWGKFRSDLRGRGRILEGALPNVTEPVLPILAGVGVSAELQVLVNGQSYSYVWRKDSVVIPSVNAPSISFANVEEEDVALYDVIVSNDRGEQLLAETFVALVESPRVVLNNDETSSFQLIFTHPANASWSFSVEQSSDARSWTQVGVDMDLIGENSTQTSQCLQASVPAINKAGFLRLNGLKQ